MVRMTPIQLQTFNQIRIRKQKYKYFRSPQTMMKMLANKTISSATLCIWLHQLKMAVPDISQALLISQTTPRSLYYSISNFLLILRHLPNRTSWYLLTCQRMTPHHLMLFTKRLIAFIGMRHFLLIQII